MLYYLKLYFILYNKIEMSGFNKISCIDNKLRVLSSIIFPGQSEFSQMINQ